MSSEIDYKIKALYIMLLIGPPWRHPDVVLHDRKVYKYLQDITYSVYKKFGFTSPITRPGELHHRQKILEEIIWGLE